MNLTLATQIKYLYEKDYEVIKSNSIFSISTNNIYNLYVIRTAHTSNEKYEASSRYIKNKTKLLKELYKECLNIQETVIEDMRELKNVFEFIKCDPKCVGYIIQEPFEVPEEMLDDYKHIRANFEKSLFDRKSVINIDVDKTTLFSKMKRYEDPDNICLYPITTRSCINLIHELELKRDSVIAVLGRSEIVTKPLIEYLIHKGYTVIEINSMTPKSKKRSLLELADCIVLATGHYGVLNIWDYDLKSNVFVIDVGINKHPETGKLVGDLALEQTYTNKSLHENINDLTFNKWRYNNTIAYTPVPGGVGKLTSIGFAYAVSVNLASLIGEDLINSAK